MNDIRQQAFTLFSEGDTDGALQLLKQAIQQHPNDTSLVLGLAQLTFQSGHLNDAEQLLTQLPEADQKSHDAKSLAALFQFSRIIVNAPDQAELEAKLQQEPNHLDARYQLAAYLMLHHQIEPAIQCLLESIQIDKNDHHGRAQKLLLDIFSLLQDDHPQLVNHYRRQLQSLLN